jgi:hypothetical protein
VAATPTRIDADLYASAQASSEIFSRSTAQQINHWARLGRALEAANTTTTRSIQAVLAGDASYDELTAGEQAVVRVEWADRAEALRADLDLSEEFVASGQSWSEATPDGSTVTLPAPGVRASTAQKGPRAGAPVAQNSSSKKVR